MKSAFQDTPKLGFGCMRLPLLDPDDTTSIDIEQLEQMVDLFIARGGTYFDTAFVYHNGASEPALGQALVKRYPRDSFTLATKCLAWAETEVEAKGNLETSLTRLGTDYLDFYLLHNVGGVRTEKFDEYGMWEFVQRKKEEGLIKNIGFSLHDGAECLDKLLTLHPEMDFVQLQVNYLDWDDPVVEAQKTMAVAAKHGKPVVIMEPARGGRLVDLPDRAAKILRTCDPEAPTASWAYRFCWNLPGVLTVLSGMSSFSQMEENTASYAVNKPFSAVEKKALGEAIAALRSVPTIPCTNCRYCVEGCPQGVMIPETMALLNLEAITGDHGFAKYAYSWQTVAGRASECIQCGACEDICPQHIDIIAQLQKAVEHFED